MEPARSLTIDTRICRWCEWNWKKHCPTSRPERRHNCVRRYRPRCRQSTRRVNSNYGKVRGQARSILPRFSVADTERRRKAEFSQVNVADWDCVLSFFEGVKNKFGSIDLVFANAGVGEKNTVFNDILGSDGSLAPPDLAVVDVNLKGVVYSMETLVIELGATAKPALKSFVF